MSCRSGGTSCTFPKKFSSTSRYSWGDEETQEHILYSLCTQLGDNLMFLTKSYAWSVSLCFNSLYIEAIYLNIIQASLGSIWFKHLLLNPNNFTNPVRNFFLGCHAHLPFH